MRLVAYLIALAALAWIYRWFLIGAIVVGYLVLAVHDPAEVTCLGVWQNCVGVGSGKV